MSIISDVVIAKGEEVMVDYTGRAGGELIFDFQGPAHREDDRNVASGEDEDRNRSGRRVDEATHVEVGEERINCSP